MEAYLQKVNLSLQVATKKINECKYSSITGYLKGPKELFEQINN